MKKSRKEVEAWDAAWRKASNEYGKLRGSPVIKFILKNERLRNALITSANTAEIEWYPRINLLSADTLPKTIREQLLAAAAKPAGPKKDGKRKRKLNTEKFESTLKEFDEFVAEDVIKSFTPAQLTEATSGVIKLLRDRFPKGGDKLKLAELLEVAYDDLVEAAEINHTEDPKTADYCNGWWCFSEVTSQNGFDYDIFFAEAEEVGYKRSTRHPEGVPRPNDLFQQDAAGQIVINTDHPKTILDHLKVKGIYSNADES